MMRETRVPTTTRGLREHRTSPEQYGPIRRLAPTPEATGHPLRSG
jgi:hypothetical protein